MIGSPAWANTLALETGSLHGGSQGPGTTKLRKAWWASCRKLPHREVQGSGTTKFHFRSGGSCEGESLYTVCIYIYIHIHISNCRQTKSGLGILWSHSRFILSWISFQQRPSKLQGAVNSQGLPYRSSPRFFSGQQLSLYSRSQKTWADLSGLFVRRHIWVYPLNFSDFSLEFATWI